MKHGTVSSGLLLRLAAGLTAAALVVTGILGSGVGVAVAQAAAIPDQTAPAAGQFQVGDEQRNERANARLEHLLKQAQMMLAIQKDRLDMAREEAAFAQERIDAAEARGKDIAAIQAALDMFKTQIEAAQSLSDNAGSILDARAGFDADGKVVDLDQARDTLRQAGDAMREASRTLREAARELRRAARQYRASQIE